MNNSSFYTEFLSNYMLIFTPLGKSAIFFYIFLRQKEYSSKNHHI